ncbi:secreted RxLR effector protein 161-like [Anneissia japonica]|uniref:secreted RxLR effector protein 161-like n=1 Tax=Anneissia japonica TaxID=1529436 RepID=UPI00142559B9|nr:secreted RxLR effector protein 161-like [Anneissia japonica]
MVCTRPDLCFVVTKLSQHLSKPMKSHFNIAKQTLRYLKGTQYRALKFVKTDNLDLVGYSDSDWGIAQDRRSISGYGFKLNHQSSLISWKSKKQPVVALSTCEAEYIALCLASQEALFLKQLFSDMMCFQTKSVKVYVDNQSAICLAKNNVSNQRSKHIDIKFHFVRSEVEIGNIVVEYIPTEINTADVFTKPFSRNRIDKLLLC